MCKVIIVYGFETTSQCCFKTALIWAYKLSTHLCFSRPSTYGAHVVEEGVVILYSQEEAGEHHSVEGNIALGHELVSVHERGWGGGGVNKSRMHDNMCQ